MTKTPLNTIDNRFSTHRVADGQTTRCGLNIDRPKPNPKLRVTKIDGDVTCKRCLKSMPAVEMVIEPNLDTFTRVMKAFMDAISPVLDLQTRMTNVAKKVADANTTHQSLTLTASEVESLAVLLYFLGQPRN